jgi:hypothetical protein
MTCSTTPHVATDGFSVLLQHVIDPPPRSTPCWLSLVSTVIPLGCRSVTPSCQVPKISPKLALAGAGRETTYALIAEFVCLRGPRFRDRGPLFLGSRLTAKPTLAPFADTATIVSWASGVWCLMPGAALARIASSIVR